MISSVVAVVGLDERVSRPLQTATRSERELLLGDNPSQGSESGSPLKPVDSEPSLSTRFSRKIWKARSDSQELTISFRIPASLNCTVINTTKLVTAQLVPTNLADRKCWVRMPPVDVFMKKLPIISTEDRMKIINILFSVVFIQTSNP